ncbi:Gp37 family protein [Paracoccus sp. P2]|uniref:Gp37 family protein n=1 Tax=Paracoccus sp. P2 TaxID=3248840 RepID=UPI00391F4863
MIGEIEKAIVERLAGRLTGVKVEAFPDKPDTYTMHHPKGVVLVAFGRATYSAPKTIDLVVQERRIEWDITLLMRNLRDHAGAYDVLDAVRLVLTGWRTSGAGKLMPVREEFLDQKQGVWTYVLTMAHTIPAVECAEEEDLPLLKRVNTTDDYGTTQAPPADPDEGGNPEDEPGGGTPPADD